MATLLLTTVGTVIGGPIGAAVGGLIGQAVDAQIFKPKGREGPRLQDLRLQTSTYGARIPRLFGTMRVAGSVIWATDLKEHSERSGGGKGRPSVTSYAYSASFAVALSSRPIGIVGRVWADGTLLRGAAGDFKAGLGGMRFHGGLPGQAADPLIAAAVGADRAPAFRDLAYMVFEDLQLGDFGNRIPALTFEIVADGAPVGIGEIAGDLLAGAAYASDGDAPTLAGYAADGGDARGALAPLVETFDLCTRTEQGLPLFTSGRTSAQVLRREDQVRHAGTETVEPETMRRGAIEAVPVRLALRYYDPARDYQAGVQSAERPGPGRRTLQTELAATLPAGQARQIADRRLRVMARRRTAISMSAGWAALDLAIGDLVRCEGRPGRWRVEAIEWEAMVARLTLVSHEGDATIPDGLGDPGTAANDADRLVGPTTLALIELPALDDSAATTPLVYAAATGGEAGWRGAALFRVNPATGDAQALGATAGRAVIGTTLGALAPASACLIDRAGSVDVALVSGRDGLAPADDAALGAGANLCMIGRELVQFGAAQEVAPHVFRLSRLVRGVRGTEWAAGLHETGERFVLIEAARLAPVPLLAADLGRAVALRAIGVGDAVPAEAGLTVNGLALLPPSPVHGRLDPASDGALLVRWTRRSRAGWQWPSGTDVPLGEEIERYRVRVLADGAALRTAEVPVPPWNYAEADRLSDAATAGTAPLVLEIRQIGTAGLGMPLLLPIPDDLL